MPAQNNTITADQLFQLLTPSAISSVFCVIISLAISLGAILINRYKSSSLELQYKYYQTHHTVSNSHLGGSILNNEIVKDLPLIVFWAVVGVVVYLIAADIVKALRSAIEFRKELDYVHVQRNLLITNIFIQFGLRALVIVISLPYLIFLFHRILPYVIQVSILATTASNVFTMATHIVVAVLICSVALHITLVLARLLFLKARLFTYSMSP